MAEIEYQISLVDELFNKRILIIDKELDESTCGELISRLILLDLNGKIKKQPIILMINTYGGDMSGAFGVADIISSLNSPVYTVCIGIAHSGGSVLLAAGSKRYALPGADIMIHQHHKEFAEVITHTNLMNEAKISKIYNEKLVQYYLGKTNGKITKTKLNELLKIDSYLSSQEALNYGFIDEITLNINDWLHSK